MALAAATTLSLGAAAIGAHKPEAIPVWGPVRYAESTRLPELKPTVAAVKNDLNPRPLGPSANAPAARPQVGIGPIAPAEKSKLSQQSAAGALWDNPVIRTGGSLLLVLLLIVGLAAIAKRLTGRGGGLLGAMGPGGKAPEGLLEVLGRYPLSRGQTLILLKVDNRVLLLSQTTPRMRGGVGTLTTLCEINRPEDVASILVKAGEHDSGSSSGKFTAILRSFDRSHAAAEADHVDIDPRRMNLPEQFREEEFEEPPAAPEPEELPPVLHKFPAKPTFAPPPEPQRAVFEPLIAAGGSGADSFSSIRQRLHALRGEAHR
jgi:flagellar biogenesis protein FliO